jgi:hydrogenase maturation protease
LRGDDAIGLLIAERLRARAIGQGIDVVSGASDAASLLAQFEGAAAVIAVDCARGGGPPGTILRLPPDPKTWPRARPTSSHGNALADAVALGEALGCLPERLSVLVVVGEAFGIGAPLSPAVRDAMPALAACVLREAVEMVAG